MNDKDISKWDNIQEVKDKVELVKRIRKDLSDQTIKKFQEAYENRDV